MRLNLILGTALSLAALVFSSQVVLEENVNATTEAPESTEPVVASASFPESNPFGHIVNGEKNTITLTVENKSGKNATLISVGGAVYNVQTDALIKNLTTLAFNKPGDIRLNIWLDHTLEVCNLLFTSVTNSHDMLVLFPATLPSCLPFPRITTYLMTAALLGGLIFVSYKAFAPKQTTRKKKPAPSVSAPVGAVTATGADLSQKSGTLTSGDEFSELSAGELSSPEKEKKVKGKARK
ncbi:hypothetical protein B0H13DRAFT_1965506 [Mycena leptocephala]|nr:hypothetical protein B0H13DRAFT_1965506 [Mycena leptocephala]